MLLHPRVLLAGVLAVLAALHVVLHQPGELQYNGDETRHVMTGGFFRDLLLDCPAPADLKDDAVRYYLQYPALGLLVWPPLLYVVEGAFMLLFGTSFLAARVLVGLFAAMACAYLFALVRRTHDTGVAVVAVLLLGLSPLVFELSHQVMLEVPALAFALAALFHVQRYLDEERGRDLVLGTLATAGTALARFDGIFRLPLYLILVAGRGKLRMLLRGSVLAAVAVALLLVLPYYLFAASQVGGAHYLAATSGTSAGNLGFLAPQNFVYYPRCVPAQIGWFAVPPALVGVVVSLHRDRRATAWPYFALVLATYLTFTPLAEVESRHAICWVPALAVFAAEGCRVVAGWLRPPLAHYAVPAIVLAGTGWLGRTLGRGEP